MLWMAEWVEILMSLTSNWNAGDSSGEGLSHYCALELLQVTTTTTTPDDQVFVQNWLNGDGHDEPGQQRRPIPPAPTGSTTPSPAPTSAARTSTATAIRLATVARSRSSTT